MTILGIETSCDETAAAIVQDGTQLISQSIASSLDQHQITGGVVPEVAARAQVEYIIPVLQQALQPAAGDVQRRNEPQGEGSEAGRPEKLALLAAEIDAIAVTIGPGLIGSLLIGVETAKTLAYTWNKPLIPINHMLGHIYGAWLTYGNSMDERWPKLVLLASGGHTELILMESHRKFNKIGQTLDDASGEAFDKVAKLLNLPYPGGPSISKLAESGNARGVELPLPLRGTNDYNFSFSGLKTAVLNQVRTNPNIDKADLAASFQQTVIDHLVDKTRSAAKKFEVNEIILGGGVAANTELRRQLFEKLAPIEVKIPDLKYTTDNAAVIASAAFYHQNFTDWRQVQANPNLELPIDSS